MDWKQAFIDLFNSVAACEAPEGTQVDDVLEQYQAQYDMAVSSGVSLPEKPYVVVTGSPFDGLTILGPFDGVDEANQWTDTNVIDDEWWVVEVETPEED
jgi:hypothetical protein